MANRRVSKFSWASFSRWALLSLPLGAWAAAGTEFVGASDSRLQYSDYVRLSFVSAPGGSPGGTNSAARFDRLLDIPGKGYQWDNPGARLRFRCDGSAPVVHLFYSDKHISTSARNGLGHFFIDGKWAPEYSFRPRAEKVVRAVEVVEVAMPQATGMHTYELVLPYGDSVDVLGVSVPLGTRFETPPARPKERWVFYGDSITHGFTASGVARTFPFRLAEIKNVQMINFGLGGRSCSESDGPSVAALGGQRVVVLIGVNDWQGGRPLDAFKAQVSGLLQKIGKTQPVHFITPLWVAASWKPGKAAHDLEAYRQVIRDLVTATGDPGVTLSEGPSLIDHDPALFDAVAVHPNDQGFEMMAQRLAAAIR